MDCRVKDETNKVYGSWKVIRFYDIGTNRNARWLCECTECGESYIRYGHALRSGKTRCCNNCSKKRRRH